MCLVNVIRFGVRLMPYCLRRVIFLFLESGCCFLSFREYMRGYHDSPLSAFLHKQQVSFPTYFSIHMNAFQSHEHGGDASVLNHETNMYSRVWKSGTRTSFDMFVIYFYKEIHILLLNITSYGLREGLLSTYILNIRCHRFQVVKKNGGSWCTDKDWVLELLTRDKSRCIKHGTFRTQWPRATCISWESSRFQWTKSTPSVDVVIILFELLE